jgi:glycine oxidase
MITKSYSTLIIGGGIIGLSIGWQLARRGVSVCIIERGTAGHAASWAAAGMLAPQAEVGFEEEAFLKFGEKSLALYPQFLSELKEDSATDVLLDRCGTMMVGIDRDDAAYLKRLYDFRRGLGLAVEWLGGSAARDREPYLSPKIVSAVWLPNDAQIDNRALVTALKTAFVNRGGVLYENTPVENIGITSSTATHVITPSGEIYAKQIVVAAGCWSRQVEGIEESMRPAVRPVKGQILNVSMTSSCELSHVVRSPRVYLAPKSDNRLVIGATSEEMGFDVSPTAGGVMDLLRDGWELVPSIYELPLNDIRVGLRPATPDHEPLLGESGIAGLLYATGHYRHGILLAPVTAYEMAKHLCGESFSDYTYPFLASRLTPRSRPVQAHD